jgi:hypothetical protein
MKKASESKKRGDVDLTRSEDDRGAASKPISLAPLSFDEALDGLLGVKPEPKGKPKATKKPAKKTTKTARRK